MDPAVSLAAVAIEQDLNPNVLRRWVIECRWTHNMRILEA